MADTLDKKSIHDLRIIAQSFGIKDIFSKDAIHLRQEIELKQDNIIPKPLALPPKPHYDARLMTEAPSARGSLEEITDLLAPFIKLGLHLKFDEENWSMVHGKKNDSGTIRMPLRTILNCAQRVMS